MRTEKAEYLRDLVHELAEMAEQDDLELFAYLLRMAEAEAAQEIERKAGKSTASR